MRILILNYEYPPVGGGGGVAAHNLAQGFISLGHSVYCITSHYKGLKWYEDIKGVHVYRVPVIGRKSLSHASFISMLTFLFPAFMVALWIIPRNKINLINTHFAVPTGPVGIAIKWIYGLKNILSLHAGDIYDPSRPKKQLSGSPHTKKFYRFIIPRILNRFDFLVAQSNNTKENTIKYYHPKKNIHIIPLAYDPVKFKPVSRTQLGLNQNNKYIIAVGRLVPRKGFDFFIDVLAKLPTNIHGIIIGEGPEKNSLLNRAKKSGVEKRFHMPGFISEEKKFQYLDNSDLYFLSSVHEGFGIVLQEAMQIGLPIVSTNFGGQVDLVKEGKNGYLIKFRDVSGAVEKIQVLMNNGSLYKQFSLNCKNLINSFKSREIAKNYISLSLSKKNG